MTVHGVYDDIDLSVAPMATEDVKNRLVSLEGYDEQIIKLLEVASQGIKSVQNGKSGASTEESKQEFEKATKEYFSLVESISVGLRNEIRLLHNESKEKVLPLSLAAKADTVGKHKEKAIWKSINELLEGSSNDKKNDTDNNTDDKNAADNEEDEQMADAS